jgi:hypothetical protein
MKFRIEREIDSGDGLDTVIRFCGSFTSQELAALPLSPLDWQLLINKHESPADFLLALECIYRAYERAKEAKEAKEASQ